jgi:hypothetical protein
VTRPFVNVREVGLRDGLQMLEGVVPADVKHLVYLLTTLGYDRHQPAQVARRSCTSAATAAAGSTGRRHRARGISRHQESLFRQAA